MGMEGWENPHIQTDNCFFYCQVNQVATACRLSIRVTGEISFYLRHCPVAIVKTLNSAIPWFISISKLFLQHLAPLLLESSERGLLPGFVTTKTNSEFLWNFVQSHE